MGMIGVMLVFVAVFIGLPLGLLMLSQATMGVGVLAASCLTAVVARMFQASAHHREAMAHHAAPWRQG